MPFVRSQQARLERWVLNPQQIKPGTQMPPSPLSTSQLDALLAYLETLK